MFSVRIDRIYGFEEVLGSFIVSFNTESLCKVQTSVLADIL